MKNIKGSIICEGADQSGKTFVCNLLSEKLGYPIHHFSAPKPGTDFKLEYVEPLLTGGPYIFDRSYLSEMVYGELFRGGSGMTDDVKKYVEDFLNSRHCIMAYLRRKNYKWQHDREEMYTEIDNEKVMRKYDELYPKIMIPKLITDSYDANCIELIMELYNKNNP